MKKLHLQPKLLLGLILMGVILMLSLTVTISIAYRSHMETQHSQNAFKMATMVANMIDGDTISGYHDTLKKDAYYEEIRQKLIMIRETNEIKYLYIVVPEDYQFYIWDTGSEESIEAGEVCDLGDLDEYITDEAKEIMLSAFKSDAEKIMAVTNSEQYGYLASGYVAILDSNNNPAALVGVDLNLDEINHEINLFVTVLVLVAFGILVVSSILYYFYIRKILINPIKALHNDTVKLVSDQMDNLDTFSNRVHTGDELEELGKSFEYMTHELSDYIKNLAFVTAEKERIGAELNVAAQIQADMLPRIFPAFPDRTEFDLYASMTPAKEVGGDFYDFFMIDDSHLGMVMADVSGKGVPAALFMVIAKTLIKNRSMMGGGPAEILKYVNDQLCESNDAELFVTVWLAVIDITTGKGIAANAGHEHPAIRRADGKFELIKYRHSPAVATMEGMRFKEHEFELHPGDSLFVYTDGVTEATNAETILFGEERLTDALNIDPGAAPAALIANVRGEIEKFVGEAPQFDDITMLGFSYAGPEGKKKAPELTLDATDENLDKALAFIDENLGALDCSPKVQMQIDVAVEELFVNVAHYAYAPEVGQVTLRFESADDPRRAVITLIDGGVQYDPLAKPDPDITLSAEERPIGGLGIFMVKKSMDDVQYEYKDKKNILSITKII